MGESLWFLLIAYQINLQTHSLNHVLSRISLQGEGNNELKPSIFIVGIKRTTRTEKLIQ